MIAPYHLSILPYASAVLDTRAACIFVPAIINIFKGCSNVVGVILVLVIMMLVKYSNVFFKAEYLLTSFP